MNPSVYNVYLDFIWRGTNTELAQTLYNSPPHTLDAVIDQVPRVLEQYRDTLWHIDERMNLLEKVLISSNRNIGCLTPEVMSNIRALRDGAVEAAHQTVVLGGPAYVLNKAITTKRVSDLCSESGLSIATFFCLADYDVVQPELTNIRLPVMGSGGTLVSIPVPEGYENSPVSVLPLPSKDWYNQIEDEIRDTYRPMFKILEGASRSIFDERLEQALSILRWSYINSTTLGGWATRVLGRLFNVEGRLGLPLVIASSEEIRDLLVEGAEFLLARENREKALLTFNETTSLIQENGYNPGIGSRNTDYVPFFYECPEASCNKARIELHYEDQGPIVLLKGKCPTCSETIEIETSADSPYLGDVARDLSLRVDSRQIAIDTIIPTVVHVGGSGETAYYAQVIPSANAMSIPFPIFVKYPRVYFNTPWNEQLAKSLEGNELPVLQRKEMFGIMGKISKFRKKGQFDEMNKELENLESLIMNSHSQLNNTLREIESNIMEASGERVTTLLNLKMDLERYLSWAFGQFAEEKLGQESSWAWIEWAINTGFTDLFGPYERAYVGPLKNGATLFVNFSV
ncbi:MAG: bacillithiol biosynthesis BshC [Candidatus Odinarchaeota archaeon]